MTDPIQRNSSSPQSQYDAQSARNAGAQAPSTTTTAPTEGEGAVNSCELPPALSEGVELLASSHSKPTLALFVAEQATTEASTDTDTSRATTTDNSNAERTASMQAFELPHASAGLTQDQRSMYAELAMLKGSEGQLSAEIASVSIQGGDQSEAQAAVARGTLRGEQEAVNLRMVEIEAHYGIHNPDGSTGINAGATASSLAVEVSYENAGNSVVAGLAAGPGLAGSLGTRDADADRNTEYCASVAVGPITVGLCLEADTLGNAVRSLVGARGDDR